MVNIKKLKKKKNQLLFFFFHKKFLKIFHKPMLLKYLLSFMLELNQFYYSIVCQKWPRNESWPMHLSSLGTLCEIKKTNTTNTVSYFLLGSVGYNWRWAMRLWWWFAWQSIERDEYEREFFKCLGLLSDRYLDKLVTSFLHASCLSISTCPGADYNRRKRDK